MKLKKILEGIDYKVLSGNDDCEINKIEYDSRKVVTNDVFVCIKGFATDGHKYIKNAVELGAKTIIVQDDVEVNRNDINIIKVQDTRKALALAGENYYGNPSKKINIIGITGTNGKTTTSFMIKDILEQAGKKTGLIGTIANYIGNKKIPAERTTPESLELAALLKNMVDENVEYCVMEVSSHSLALDRVYGIEFKGAIFTNLTRDHLDFHKTFENYYRAKFKLFEMADIKLINIDDDYGKNMVEDLNKLKRENIYTFSLKENSNFKAKDEVIISRETKFKVELSGKDEDFFLEIPGDYNIYNALGAIAICSKLGIDVEIIKKGIKETLVPGRCERCAKEYSLPYEIIIDYAHTPDGLLNILETARQFTKGRLISVFGCGGDRDKIKRPEMGKIGVDLSDTAIITSDNPRSENPEEIINDIKKGLYKDNYIIIENRKDAIKKAIDIAQKDDVIVIAGKGHETYQILKDKTIHFDEREVIKEILKGI